MYILYKTIKFEKINNNCLSSDLHNKPIRRPYQKNVILNEQNMSF